MAMIEMNGVSKWYGSFQVLTRCTTKVEKGEVVVVCGPSGSGKSTLIKCINGLEPFDSGEIIVDGVSVGDRNCDLPKLRSKVGMVFQQFELFPHLDVEHNIMLAQRRVLGRDTTSARERAHTCGSRTPCPYRFGPSWHGRPPAAASVSPPLCPRRTA